LDPLLSPTGVAAMLIFAATIDYLSVGPDSLRDRLAFLIALPMIKMGFDGGPLDQFTVGALTQAINALKGAAGGSYIAGAATDVLLTVLVACLTLYAVGALLPDKASKRLGPFATMKLPKGVQFRINIKLWVLAFALGVLSDLPSGVIGDLLRSVISMLTGIVSWLPGWLFGVS
jgi:hypothetical protein